MNRADKHRHNLKAAYNALNTPDGNILLQEIGLQLEPENMKVSDPVTLAYLAGQRDAHRYIQQLAAGDLIEDLTDV